MSPFACLPSTDSIVHEFHHGFSDTARCVTDIKRTVLRKVNHFLVSQKKVVLDSTDLTAIGLFRPTFENCGVTVLLLLYGFDTFLLTLNSELGIIDLRKTGENKPTIWFAPMGTGRYEITKLFIQNCRCITSKSILYELSGKKKRKLSDTSIIFAIEPSGQITTL